MTPFTLPLPTYQCHKRVQALRIKLRISNPRGVELHFEDERFCPIQMSHEWEAKHEPDTGMYVVWYEDGYVSVSPAAAFEAGYTLVEHGDMDIQNCPHCFYVFPTQQEGRPDWSAWPGGPSEVDAALASRDAEIERLRIEVGSKQAEIDRLMLEFCPAEMTPEQIEEWARHQKPVGPATQAAREVGK